MKFHCSRSDQSEHNPPSTVRRVVRSTSVLQCWVLMLISVVLATAAAQPLQPAPLHTFFTSPSLRANGNHPPGPTDAHQLAQLYRDYDLVRSSTSTGSGGGVPSPSPLHDDELGYVVGVLRPSASMSHVRQFVGHDDVHFIHHRVHHHDGGAQQPHRHVLVFHMGHSECQHDPCWIHKHRRAVSAAAAEGPMITPFVKVLRVPLQSSAHLHPSLWPPVGRSHRSKEETPPSASATSQQTVVLDVSVTLADSKVAQLQHLHEPAGTAMEALVQLVEARMEDALAGSLCAAKVVVNRNRRKLPRVVKVRLTSAGSALEGREDCKRNRTALVSHCIAAECAPVLAALSSASFVRWVEPVQQFQSQNHVATISMQNPQLVGGQVHALWERGITGEGQLVAIGDTGLDYDSCFFADPAHDVVFYPATNPQHRKVLSYQQCEDDGLAPDHTDAFGGHGTHVAGSAAGNSLNGNQEYNGMAKDARIFFQDLTCTGQSGLLLPSDLEEYYEPAYNLGARVSSNSWGGEHPTAYVTTDRLSDKFLYEHQNFFVTVAVGNSPLTGILSPATSKNVLSVGAHMNSFDARTRETLASFSARGPTYDQRIKPDITAPGNPVTSALSDGRLESFQCSTTVRMGTSMATPHVAGSAILLRQYLAEGYMTPTGYQNRSATHRIKTPSSALMKALIVQAAVPMTGGVGTAPNGMQGFGRLELPALMHIPSSSDRGTAATPPFRWMVDKRTIRSGEQQTFCFSVTTTTPSTAPVSFVRATLVWTDAASALEGSPHSLVNDLDLVVIGDDGSLYHQGPAVATSAGGGVRNEVDRHNNVEQVTISVPSLLGRAFRVVVYGFDVPDDARYGGQPFALTVWGPGLTYSEECPASTSCPNHCSGVGQCIGGSCVCPATHHGVDCASCNSTHVCHGNGVCSFDLTCTCATTGHFQDAASCDPSSCAAGWYGPHCDNNCQCGGSTHGACDDGGACVCVKPTTEPTALVPPTSSCYGGTACQWCCRDTGGPTCSERSFWCSNRQTRIINATELLAAAATDDDAPQLSSWRTGLIQIDGYGHYPNSQKCGWLFVVPPPPPPGGGGGGGWQVRITFTKFDVESPYDYVRVINGDTVASGHLMQQFTGSQGQGQVLTSNAGSNMLVTFFSDYTGPAAGFTAEYQFIPSSDTPPITTTTTTTSTTTTTAAPQLTPAPTSTTTAAPQSTPAPTSTTTAAPPAFVCSSLMDCATEGTDRCDPDTRTCVCRSPEFIGDRCEQRCPVTLDQTGGVAHVCNGKGRCTSAHRCESCMVGFTGNGCQLDVFNGLVSGDRVHGSSVVLVFDMLRGVLPIPKLTVPIQSALSSNLTSSSSHQLIAGSVHYFLLKLPAPSANVTVRNNTSADGDSYADYLTQHPPRLRMWVLRPNVSTQAPPPPPVTIAAWPSYEAAGDFTSAVLSPCVDYVPSTTTNDGDWISASVAVAVPSTEEPSSSQHWFLHIEPVPDVPSQTSSSARLESCVANPQYLQAYAEATASLHVSTGSPGSTEETVIVTTNRTTVTSIASALDAVTAVQAALAGVAAGIVVGVVLAVQFVVRHRGFHRADLGVDPHDGDDEEEGRGQQVDADSDGGSLADLELHNEAISIRPSSSSTMGDVRDQSASTIVDAGALRAASTSLSGHKKQQGNSSVDDDEDDDDLDEMSPMQQGHHSGGSPTSGNREVAPIRRALSRRGEERRHLGN